MTDDHLIAALHRACGADTFLVARDVRLDAIPRGRMSRLDPGANPWA